MIYMRHSRRRKVIRWVAVWVWARQVGVWLVGLGHVSMWPCGLSKTHIGICQGRLRQWD